MLLEFDSLLAREHAIDPALLVGTTRLELRGAHIAVGEQLFDHVELLTELVFQLALPLEREVCVKNTLVDQAGLLTRTGDLHNLAKWLHHDLLEHRVVGLISDL